MRDLNLIRERYEQHRALSNKAWGTNVDYKLRIRPIAYARFCLWYALSEYGYNSNDISKQCGYSRGAIINGIKQARNLREQDESFKMKLNIVSTRYLDDDVVLTTDDEFFFYWEVKKYNLTVKKGATEKEAADYIKEFAYWQKEEQWNQAAANYGSSYGG